MTKRNTTLISKDSLGEVNIASVLQPFLLKPACKDYLWGGKRLEKEFGKNYGISPLAETWECSVHPDGVSIIDSGVLKELPLDVAIKKYPSMLGTHPRAICGEGELPVLIKLIDAGQAASVQVHPDDEYARIYENGENGKTEMWYILDAAKEARLVYGFQQRMDRETIKKAVNEDCIEKYLQKVPVQKDDVFYIAPGQVHAIGEGILLAEIQQNSNITYRLYDYKREDQNGNLRELHLDKALEVANLQRSEEPHQPMRVLKYQPGCATELLCRCKYFQVERMLINVQSAVGADMVTVGKESFVILLCIEGEGELESNNILEIKKGNCVFVPADCGQLKLKGKMQLLKIRC
ncbi:MAG: class I mannose-6-phosphate isomerase [Lachnospiraceae bacterium]|nr:class I mannose-6-phosphate isomerase [Lachnospiraceae bacterium]